MKLLHVDSSILGEASVSRTVSAAIVERLTSANPTLDVEILDLAAHPIPHLSGAYLAGTSADVKHDQALQEDLALGGAALAQFLAADIVVIGVPMYNFSIPSQLKAWIDRVCVAGKTFRYTDKGAEGLCRSKRVVLAISRGGFYGPETPQAAAEHQESYLKALFTFLGVKDIEIVRAEGIAYGPDHREKALASAKAEAATLRAA